MILLTLALTYDLIFGMYPNCKLSKHTNKPITLIIFQLCVPLTLSIYKHTNHPYNLSSYMTSSLDIFSLSLSISKIILITYDLFSGMY